MNSKILASALLLLAVTTGHQPGALAQPPDTLATLQARVESLRAPNVAWRKIAWKSCLLEGLKASREQKKPALLWVFIDRPVDDARC
jgi:hypothetical protein